MGQESPVVTSMAIRPSEDLLKPCCHKDDPAHGKKHKPDRLTLRRYV